MAAAAPEMSLSNVNTRRRGKSSAPSDDADTLAPVINKTMTAANAYLKSAEASDNPLSSLIATMAELLAVLAKKTCNSTSSDSFEKVERERSAVIAGLVESTDSKPSARRAHDVAAVTDILDTIDSEAVPVAVYRMGAPPQQPRTGPRLLKVVFATRRSQREVLSKFSSMARELKQDFQFKNLFIRRSMTAEEREQDKQLRDEAKRRRDAGEKCWIYAGKLVTERVHKPQQSRRQGNRY